MTGPADVAPLELRQFKPSYETLGILVDYLAKTTPFAECPAAELVMALKHHIADGHHVCAFRGDRLVGYCGWLLTTVALGEAWREGKGALRSTPADAADAAALTIVRADDDTALAPMIRKIRTMNKGKRIFFRRDYADGKPRKRQTVLNV